MEMQDLVSPPDRGNDPDSQAALAEAWGPGADWSLCTTKKGLKSWTDQTASSRPRYLYRVNSRVVI